MFTLDHHSLANCSPGCRAHVCESGIIFGLSSFFETILKKDDFDVKMNMALPFKVFNCWGSALYCTGTEKKHKFNTLAKN